MPPKTGNGQTVEIDKPVRTKANQKSKQEGGMVVLVVVVRTEEGEARENYSRVQAGSWTAAVRGGSVISRAVPGPKTRSLNPTCAVHPGSLASLGRCGELSVWGRMAVRWVSPVHLWIGDGQCWLCRQLRLGGELHRLSTVSTAAEQVLCIFVCNTAELELLGAAVQVLGC